MLLLRKASSYLAERLLLPDDNIPLYLHRLDVEKENKIRKLWLISFILANLFSIYFPFVTWVNSVGISPFLAFAIALLSVIPSIWITYYCAYLKRGSAFLLYLIISIPVSIVILSMNELIRPLFIWSSHLKISGILYLAALIFFWTSSIKIRRVNLNRRYHINALALTEKFKELS